MGRKKKSLEQSKQLQVNTFTYERLSASMLKTWLLCKRKFHINYINNLKSPPTDSFSLGTSVHYALEQANRDLAVNPRELNPLEVAHYIQIFKDKLAELNVQDINLFSLGEEVIRNELFSLPGNEKIIGIEKEFDLVTPEGVRIYGFIDKLVEIDSTTIRIEDYKTSVTPLSYEEAKSDVQLSMYDLAISMLYPQYTNRQLVLKYIREGSIVKSYRTAIEQSSFRKTLLAVDRAIKKYMEKTLNTPASAPKGDLNHFCNWCHLKDQCPQFVETVTTMLPAAPSILSLNDNNFVQTYKKIQAISKAAEDWKDTLKIWLAERQDENPELPIIDKEGNEVYLTSSTMKEYDVVEIGKLIGLNNLLGKATNGVPLVKIQNKNLEYFINKVGDNKLTKQVNELTLVKLKAPQIKIVKRK